MLPSFVVGTRYIATILERLARFYAKHMPIKMVEPKIDFPVVAERLQWHRIRENDPANMWLRKFLVEIAATL